MRYGKLIVTHHYYEGAATLEIDAWIHATEGGSAYVELRDNAPAADEPWLIGTHKKGEVLKVPLTAVRFTD